MTFTAVKPMHAALSPWLRLLWGIAPPLHPAADRPYIAGGAIYLSAGSAWRDHAAASAHAAAHLVYSPRIFDGDGLGAIARTLMGLLEDARVETLAIRELPGLVRLWRPLHTATPALGSGFEALLERLARALLDPDYQDPHPWVSKGRLLFHRQVLQGLAETDVRSVATQLGHDIGQMRLQFNARTYRPAPDYRDDHRWMWTADMPEAVTPPASAGSAGPSNDDESVPDGEQSSSFYPEWDRLISRLRRDWCCVIEQEWGGAAVQPPSVMDDAVRQTALRLRKPLRTLVRSLGRPNPADEGEWLDLDAVVEWQLARRLGNAPDTRVYREAERHSASAAVWLLVDHSASTAMMLGSGGHDVLHTAAVSATATAAALQAMGVACAVSAFNSAGRHAVRMVTVKPFAGPVDDSTAARLQALRPAGSTRLGAALRHATSRVLQLRNDQHWVIVLSDGEPHDVDVHDPRYLIDDARHAVNEAARLGVRMACLVLATDAGIARQIFGPAGAQLLRDIADLPRAVSRLVG